MSVYGNRFWSDLEGSRKGARIDVRETHWGLIIKDADENARRDHLIECVLKVLAVFVLFASVIPWAYQPQAFGASSSIPQLGMSAAFIAIGVGIYAHAGRGFRQEVHLDGIQREVRFASRNSRNVASIRRQIPMAQVQSCFLKRTKAKKNAAELHLRLNLKGQSLLIARGDERLLVPVLEQMADLIKVSERSRRF